VEVSKLYIYIWQFACRARCCCYRVV